MHQRIPFRQAAFATAVMLALNQLPSNASDSWALPPEILNPDGGSEIKEIQDARDLAEWEMAGRHLKSRAVPIRWS